MKMMNLTAYFRNHPDFTIIDFDGDDAGNQFLR
jgi:hypothetical protein